MRLLAALSAAALLSGCRSTPVQNAPGAGGEWYDARPLALSLRAEQRGAVAAALGVRALEELPLYDLDASLDLVGARFTLKEQVWFTNTTKETLPDLVLRIYANVTPPTGDGGQVAPITFVSGECVGAPSCKVTGDTPSAITVHPSTPLAPGSRVRVKLALSGVLEKIDSSRTNVMAQGMEGMQSLMGGAAATGNYGLLGLGDGIASFGNFYPVVARRVAGAWERGEKSTLGDLGSDEMANVRAKIELPVKAKLATSGVVAGEEPVGADRRTVTISAGCVRDFAMLASDVYEVSTRNVNGVDVRSYYLAAEKPKGEKVLDVASAALADYEKRFGAYPYTDLDIAEAAIVGGAGGVEFSGLVTAASMLYRPLDAGGDVLGGLMKQLGAGAGGGGGLPAGLGMPQLDSMLEFVVAHEVAHQWWHGLVGSDSRAHPFVDEAFAQYSAMLYVEDRYGKERGDADATANVKMNYQMMRLMNVPDSKVDLPVDDFATTMGYAGIIYGKAPYFFAALRHALGDAAFFTAVRDYVNRYRFKVAPPGAFVDVAAVGDDALRVRGIATHWLEEEHGDEDLGKADLMQMVGSMLGPGALEQLGPMMQMLNGGGDVAPPPGGSPKKGGAKPSGKPPSIEDLLKQMGP